MAIHHLSQKQLLRVVKICVVVVSICGMVWIFDGCASIPERGDFIKKTRLTVDVYLVGNRALFPHPPAQNYLAGSPVYGGYCNNTDPIEIWLLGHKNYKGYYPDSQQTLGHELLEALRFQDPEWANPH